MASRDVTRNQLATLANNDSEMIRALERVIIYRDHLEIKTVAEVTRLNMDDQVLLVDATTAAVLVYLPTATGRPGKFFHIKKKDTTANTVTITPSANETIDGSATAAISLPCASLFVVSDGSDWFII